MRPGVKGFMVGLLRYLSPLRLLFPLFAAMALCRQQQARDADGGKAALLALSYVDGWQFLDLLPLPRTLNCLWTLRCIASARAHLSDRRDQAGFGAGALSDYANRVENAIPGALLLDGLCWFYLL